MTLHGFPVKIACKVFSLTLKGAVRGWFRSVDSFKELARLFLTQFMASWRRKRLTAH